MVCSRRRFKGITGSGGVLWEEKHPPVWGCAPRLRPPGKAMTEKVVASDPGPRGEGRMPQGQEQEGRRSYLPRELRIRLFDEVNRLRRKGLTHGKITEELWRRHGVKLSISVISYWVRGVHNPYNGRYIPSIELLKPSEELAFTIGAKMGDGYAYKMKNTRNYSDAIIGLKVKDREFPAEFGRCLAKVLGRRPIRLRYSKSSERYVVKVKSQTLYELLEKPVDFNKLRIYIEHCNKCVAAFLKGFADSDGSIDRTSYIRFFNTDRELLEYIKELLKHLGIESIGPRTIKMQGKTFYNPRAMKRYIHNKDEYYIYIKADSNVDFHRKIGFTIVRKQKRLESYIKKHQTRKH
jgi:intein-encoded DNA endonuclease-like protein